MSIALSETQKTGLHGFVATRPIYCWVKIPVTHILVA